MIQQEPLLVQDEQDYYEHLQILVDEGQSPLRVDKFLVCRIKDVTRSRVQNAIAAGNILINSTIVKPSYLVKPGDQISVVLPHPPKDYKLHPENIPLDIIYEDEDVIVVNKPASMVVHPGYNNYTGTLVNALMYHFQNLPEFADQHPRPGLVHRIDKGTSGLLLIAKNELSLAHLAQQFFQHSIDRKYIALVWGRLKQNGTIRGYIDRDEENRKIMSIYKEKEGKGKLAITHYSILESFSYATLVQCQLETGRTHQIRAHMKHIGHPLFNDIPYGGHRLPRGIGMPFNKYIPFIKTCFDLIHRQALHAQSLGFIHPRTNEKIHFEVEPPEDFQALLSQWREHEPTKQKIMVQSM